MCDEVSCGYIWVLKWRVYRVVCRCVCLWHFLRCYHVLLHYYQCSIISHRGILSLSLAARRNPLFTVLNVSTSKIRSLIYLRFVGAVGTGTWWHFHSLGGVAHSSSSQGVCTSSICDLLRINGVTVDCCSACDWCRTCTWVSEMMDSTNQLINQSETIWSGTVTARSSKQCSSTKKDITVLSGVFVCR